ncbi:MAG TPA: 2-oxo-4-hydroxy-4-carboxy-5-ureidoimidazoline decarboxylase [Chloroflexota bacterium]|nr:2-oxo-4-hydroxy-4-carboxy-5-ureidoimidazoline decarboxylase [Chloroflexota bacterium]
MKREDFMEGFGAVAEGSPWVAEEVWRLAPFAGLSDLSAAFERVIRGCSADQQVKLVRAHPDLVGRAALAGTLSPDSTREQASAGLDALSTQDIAAFQRLNAAYQARFGFPFVICVRENRKQAILEGLSSRLLSSPDREIETAVGEICKIVQLRLADRVQA